MTMAQQVLVAGVGMIHSSTFLRTVSAPISRYGHASSASWIASGVATFTNRFPANPRARISPVSS